MALELRPNCELCDRDLPPDSRLAMICTFECTFCAECVAEVLHDVCPNCGGGFERRPVRPSVERRPGLSTTTRPPSTERRAIRFSRDEIEAFSALHRDVAPARR
ncbi:DUF1272 domain-containing protein [uncultured Albimonas sp.]|uniref:DUF1272 domain-containing protein n=1 Tax=uncultured Albimonas sp. TaxID=1331701 RepID=UPI0030EE7885|tara:strand:- start:10 stop:321 length:312 start_codon:yes stop_codon:yes gene_type:complete